MPIKEFKKYLEPDEIDKRRTDDKYLVIRAPTQPSSKTFGVSYRKASGMFQVLGRTLEDGSPTDEVYYPQYMIAGRKEIVNKHLTDAGFAIPPEFFDAGNPGEKVERRGSRKRDVDVRLADIHNILTAIKIQLRENREVIAKSRSRSRSRSSSRVSTPRTPEL